MRNIIITGATSGIGYSTAKHLSEAGYSLILVGRNADRLNKLCAEIVNCSAKYLLDLTEYSLIDKMFTDIREKQIKLKGLVHCAGSEGEHMPVRKISMESLEKLMRLHFGSFVEMGKNFYQRSVSEDDSSIIAISSLAAIEYNKQSLDYSASKSALNCAVKVMSKEFIKRRIRVNAIMPGYVDTDMNQDLGEYIDIGKVQPLGLIEPKQIAYLIDFLLSDNSKYITGACIPVSGGF